MIKIGDNISYQGEKFNFDRDAFATLDAMRSYPEAGVPDGFKTYCLEDGKEYRINKSNESDHPTGKWREVVGGGIKDITSLELNNHELEPGLYTTTTISGTQILVYVYNASGTITQLKITSTPATRYWSGGSWSDWSITMINQIKANGYFLSKTNGTVDIGKTTKSITQGSQKYTPDSQGNIALPEQSASLSVVNNLNSDSATDALSAAMGKELKRQIDSVQTSGGGVTIDTGRQENPLDTSVPSTKYMQAEFDRLGQYNTNIIENTKNINCITGPSHPMSFKLSQYEIDRLNRSDEITVQIVMKTQNEHAEWMRYAQYFVTDVYSITQSYFGRIRVNDNTSGGSDDFNAKHDNYVINIVCNRVTGHCALYERNKLLYEGTLDRAKTDKFINRDYFEISAGDRAVQFYDIQVYDYDIFKINKIGVDTNTPKPLYEAYINTVEGALMPLSVYSNSHLRDIYVTGGDCRPRLYRNCNNTLQATLNRSENVYYVTNIEGKAPNNGAEMNLACLDYSAECGGYAGVVEYDFTLIDGELYDFREGALAQNAKFLGYKVGNSEELIPVTSDTRIGPNRYRFYIENYNFTGYDFAMKVNTPTLNIRMNSERFRYIGSVVHLKCDFVVNNELINPISGQNYGNGKYVGGAGRQPFTALSNTFNAPLVYKEPLGITIYRPPRYINERILYLSSNQIFIARDNRFVDERGEWSITLYPWKNNKTLSLASIDYDNSILTFTEPHGLVKDDRYIVEYTNLPTDNVLVRQIPTGILKAQGFKVFEVIDELKVKVCSSIHGGDPAPIENTYPNEVNFNNFRFTKESAVSFSLPNFVLGRAIKVEVIGLTFNYTQYAPFCTINNNGGGEKLTYARCGFVNTHYIYPNDKCFYTFTSGEPNPTTNTIVNSSGLRFGTAETTPKHVRFNPCGKDTMIKITTL